MSDMSEHEEAMEIYDFDDDFQEGNLDWKIKGEFLDENEEKDYERMDHLDNYDLDELDEENYSDISFQAKLKAE